MTISPSLAALLGAIAGVVITSIFNLINTRIVKNSEERKHLKQLVVTTALENWKQQLELAKAGSPNKIIRPLDDYIIHMVALSEMLLEKPINKAVITERLNEFQEFVDAVDSFRKNKVIEMSRSRDS